LRKIRKARQYIDLRRKRKARKYINLRRTRKAMQGGHRLEMNDRWLGSASIRGA